jgi:hypothetical protein
MKRTIKSVISTLSVLALMGTATTASATAAGKAKYSGSISTTLTYVGIDGARVFEYCNPLSLAISLGMFCHGRSFTMTKRAQIPVDSQIKVRTWGQGKILVQLIVNGAEGCSGFQMNFVGYETAFENFNLYPLTGQDTDVTPTNSKAVATLMFDDRSAQLSFFTETEIKTNDGDGKATCQWSIAPNANSNFNQD